MAPHWQDPPEDTRSWDDDETEWQLAFDRVLRDLRPSWHWRPWQDVTPREEYL